MENSASNIWSTECSDGKSLNLTAADLPDGGFAFFFCSNRSYVVDERASRTQSGGIERAARCRGVCASNSRLDARTMNRPRQTGIAAHIGTGPSDCLGHGQIGQASGSAAADAWTLPPAWTECGTGRSADADRPGP